jgi:tetratricopeptide (TPR) repeat protein
MPTDRRTFLPVAVILAVATITVYSRVGSFDFTNFDDSDYVSQNEIVQRGLTLDGIRWAFTTNFMGNWHPLTWISHMLDCQLFGVNPGAHHWVSVLFHVLNTVLLLWILYRYTGAIERSAFVAALFALHPLHVESVAWIAERKDVLSAFFWLLTMWAWLQYVRTRCIGCYLLALVLFALGLMSKPMLVTLPFVLLLLDYWPLRRDSISNFQFSIFNFQFLRGFTPLLIEKIPFLLLTVASCVITFIVQKQGGAVGSLEHYSPGTRVANALIAYVAYIGKTIFPDRLAAFYPHPGSWPGWQVAGAAIVLLLISMVCISFLRRAPYLLIGWLWYLGTLMPVIGLVQVGDQAYADRYTYIPLIGLFLGGVWAVADLTASFRWPPRVALGIGVTAVAVCAVMTAVQVGYWRNSETLFRHTFAVTQNNYVACYNLGQTLSVQGHIDEAVDYYNTALRIKPTHEGAHNNLGLTFALHGQWEQATNHYAQALQTAPTNGDIHFNMAIAQLMLGHPTDAIAHLDATLRSNPRHALAHKAMGDALLALQRSAEAMPHYREALRLKPDYAEAMDRLAWILATNPDPALRNGKEAVQIAEAACRLSGYEDPGMVMTLSAAEAELGDFKRAIELARQAETVALARRDRPSSERAFKLRQAFERNQPYHGD